MKKLFLIILVLGFAGRLKAQNIAKNELSVKEIATSSASAAVPSVAEYPSYRVLCQQSKKNLSFEVYSPKLDNAEVKLVSTDGADICTIYKGRIHIGKNVFTLSSKKPPSGMYYVVSKLSSGEQFADKIVISK
jgi:hypothetical protein